MCGETDKRVCDSLYGDTHFVVVATKSRRGPITAGRPGGSTGRRWLSVNQGERPQEESALISDFQVPTSRTVRKQMSTPPSLWDFAVAARADECR